MICEIHTIKRIRANLEYLYTVSRFAPGKVGERTQKKLNKKQIDGIIAMGGFQKIEITSVLGNYFAFQKCVEYPQIQDIVAKITHLDFREDAVIMISGVYRFYKVSIDRGDMKLFEIDKNGNKTFTFKYLVRNISRKSVVFSDIRGQEEIYYLNQLLLVDDHKLKLIKDLW